MLFLACAIWFLIISLETLALNAFGSKEEQGNDWMPQLTKARADSPAITY